MKFQVLSDLHLEFFGDDTDRKASFIKSLKTDADYVLLAGDISTGKNLLYDYNLVTTILGKIIFITGNHEYYNSNKKDVDDMLSMYVEGAFLNNLYIEIDDVVIIGGTGWHQSFNTQSALLLNDFRIIEELKNDNHIGMYWHNETYRFFDEALNKFKDKTVICLTHNAPLFKCTPLKYLDNKLNIYFCNNWSDMFAYNPKYWVYGHMHESNNFVYKNTHENFVKHLIIEV